MAERSSPSHWRQRLFETPSIASLLAVVLLFCVCLGLLHSRYAINDDLKLISIVAGYPAGNAAPFLVHINVLFGFILLPLYGLHTAINWEIWLFVVLDALSLWALLYILCAERIGGIHKLIGTAVILACGSYFALNLTFTNAAALADFAGLCLIVACARSGTPLSRLTAVYGLVLVVLGSTLRIEVLALTLPLVVTALVFLYPSLRIRSLLALLLITGLAVFSAYAFDRVYVRSHADWNAYYHYNRLAEQLRDAHRLENAGFIIKRISWSSNDQELFARLFFPDPNIYSAERLQYLVDHIPATTQNPLASVQPLAVRILSGTALTALLLTAAIWLLALAERPSGRSVLATSAILVVSLTENLGLVWAYKDPDYSLFALLANTAILCLLVFTWLHLPDREEASQPRRRLPLYYASLALLVIAIAMVIGQSVSSSSGNAGRRTEYQRILADIGRLQAQGKIASDAIIVSPAHGLPWQWSNPLILEFPQIPFLDTGWITFSPFYDQALQKYDLEPLPQALVRKDNVYLMTKLIFQRFLARYYEEHEHMTVSFEAIYNMPNTYDLTEYGDIQLYRVIQVK